jgi:hypothetical protein
MQQILGQPGYRRPFLQTANQTKSRKGKKKKKKKKEKGKKKIPKPKIEN